MCIVNISLGKKLIQKKREAKDHIGTFKLYTEIDKQANLQFISVILNVVMTNLMGGGAYIFLFS